MDLKGRNFLTLKDFTPEEITYLLDLSAEVKEKKKKGIPVDAYKGKNVALLFEIPFKYRQLFLKVPRDLSEDQILPLVIEYRSVILPHFFKHSVGKTSETQDVDIHDPSPWMHETEVFLSLHRELFRYKDQIILFRVLDRLLYDILIETVGFAASGITEYKLQ